MQLLSLHFALSFLPRLSCSWTLSLRPRFHPSSFSCHWTDTDFIAIVHHSDAWIHYRDLLRPQHHHHHHPRCFFSLQSNGSSDSPPSFSANSGCIPRGQICWRAFLSINCCWINMCADAAVDTLPLRAPVAQGWHEHKLSQVERRLRLQWLTGWNKASICWAFYECFVDGTCRTVAVLCCAVKVFISLWADWADQTMRSVFLSSFSLQFSCIS